MSEYDVRHLSGKIGLREQGTSIRDMIDVGAGIDETGSSQDGVEHVTFQLCPRIILPQELAERLRWWWEQQMLTDVSCHTARTSAPLEICHEGLVKSQNLVPVCHIRWEQNVHLQIGIAHHCGIDVDASEVEVFRVSSADELSGHHNVSTGNPTRVVKVQLTASAMYGMYTPA